jgi:predicted aldo/keto reductase-like oxidoreductase
VWSLPVSVLVSGPDSADHIKEKIALARSFAGLDEKERTALIQKVADLAGKRVEFYKA